MSAVLGSTLAGETTASAAAGAARPNGFAFRLAPLVGLVNVRARYELSVNGVNGATYLRFQQDQSVVGYGAALRAGWEWGFGSHLLMVGLGYTLARGQAGLSYSGSRQYELELHPAFDSMGLVLDALFAGGRVGLEGFTGMGRVDSGARGDYDVVRGGTRNGYLLGLGLRLRIPRDTRFAASIGLAYELLGFAPAMFAPTWTSGQLACLRLGTEFDMVFGAGTVP